nr:MAG TPA: hypothetical protein [Caudoviricetes sp.]
MGLVYYNIKLDPREHTRKSTLEYRDSIPKVRSNGVLGC